MDPSFFYGRGVVVQVMDGYDVLVLRAGLQRMSAIGMPVLWY